MGPLLPGSPGVADTTGATLSTLPSVPKTVSRLKEINPYESTAITEVRVGGVDARVQEVGIEGMRRPITVDRRALAKTYILLVEALAVALLLTTEPI
jgi:hypothetical protein